MTEMSRRDHFAVMILAGMAGNSAYSPHASPEALTELANLAIEQADELISCLDALKVAEAYKAHAPEEPKSSDAYWADRLSGEVK